MRVICPEHNGTVEVGGTHISNVKSFAINDMVVECPVCDEEVMINGVFDYDEQGVPVQVK
jgi:hypothetical protein